MDSSISLKDQIWFLRVCHHILFSLYCRTRAWPHVRRGQLKCDGTRTETRFRLSAKRTSPFKSAGASVQSTTGSRGVRISDSNGGYTMFRGSVKGIGYPLHSPVSPSLPLQCITVCHDIETGVYSQRMSPRVKRAKSETTRSTTWYMYNRIQNNNTPPPPFSYSALHSKQPSLINMQASYTNKTRT